MIEILVMSQGRSPLLLQAQQSIQAQETPGCEWTFRSVIRPGRILREKEILSSKADWILFLDEDCCLPDPGFLRRLHSLISSHPGIAVWGGLYTSQQRAQYAVRAYNELCNFWVLLSHRTETTTNLLGGALALNVTAVRPCLIENPIAWGGEETFLLRHLQRAGLKCRLSDQLNVIHAPSDQSLRRIWRRGLRHGENRSKHQLATSAFSKRGLEHALKNLRYWPIWMLHFVSLAKGSINQKLVPSSRNRQ